MYRGQWGGGCFERMGRGPGGAFQAGPLCRRAGAQPTAPTDPNQTPAKHRSTRPPKPPAEVGAEKPSPIIFEAAVQSLGVTPAECVHVGDDRRNDVWGGRDAGVTAWLWGSDVHSFEEVARRVLHMQRSGLRAFWDDEDEN